MKKCCDKAAYMATSLLIMLTGAGLTTQSHAQPVMQQDLDRCMTITKDRNRLACFERLARNPAPAIPIQPVRPTQADNTAEKVPSGQSVPTLAGPTAPDTPKASAALSAAASSGEVRDTFGLREKPKRETREDKTRQTIVASAEQDHQGRIVLTMENGQIWRQKDKTPVILPSAGDSALIEKGFLGGYSLRINKRTIRVERLK